MRYARPEDLDRAIKDRLRKESQETGLPLSYLRKRLAVERFLARLAAGSNEGLVVTGAFALSTLLNTRRPTQDLDLEAWDSVPDLWDLLQAIAERRVEDGFSFLIRPKGRFQRGWVRRFTLDARLGGALFEEVALDVHILERAPVEPVRKRLPGVLAFAGIEPPEVLMAPLTWQYANKLHAYARARKGPRSRVKDLVDLAVLTLELPERVNSADLIAAIDQVYAFYGGPSWRDLSLPDPPRDWRSEFGLMAKDAGLDPPDMDHWFRKVRDQYEKLRAQASAAGGEPLV